MTMAEAMSLIKCTKYQLQKLIKEEKISATSAIAMLGKFENEPNEFWLDPIIVHEAIKMISEIGKKKHDVSGDVE